MKQRLIILAIVLTVCLGWVWSSGQTPDRLGASIYVQATTPDPSLLITAGHLWFDTSVGKLKVVTSLNPVIWTELGSGGTGDSVPAGADIVIFSGSCPAGYTEDTAADGKAVIGTLTAHSDIGTTGGSDAITPAGTIEAISAGTPAGTNGTVAFTPVGSNSQPTFTGNAVASTLVSGGTPTGTVAWPAGVPTFAGAQLATHLHGFGTIAVAAHTVVATKQGASAGNVVTTATHTVSGSTAAITAGTPSGTVAWPAGVPTFSGSALGTHQHSTTATGSVSAPGFTGTPGTVPAETFTGSPLATHSHTFTGTPGDNRSAYVKAIFCRKL